MGMDKRGAWKGKLTGIVIALALILVFEYGSGLVGGFSLWGEILINLGLIGIGFIVWKGGAFGKIFGTLCFVLAIFGLFSSSTFGAFIIGIPILGPLIVSSVLSTFFGVGSLWRIAFLVVIVLYFFFRQEPTVKSNVSF